MSDPENPIPQPYHFVLTPDDNERLSRLCGHMNEHWRLIESRLPVRIFNRGHQISLEYCAENGSSDLDANAQQRLDDFAHETPMQSMLAATKQLIQKLYQETASGPLEAETVHLFLREMGFEKETEDFHVQLRSRKGQVRPRGKNQQGYVRAILGHDINFGVGPAGTGKTYLAVACAVDALLNDRIRRLLLVRPAVEAGEKLGFLPGDLTQKIDPYLRPLYDALYELLGFEQVNKFIEKQVIEVAPLAYMRGRTLNHSFIILDESQNTTQEQMKMFLTRIGFGSTAVITGDATQIDLPRGTKSGLKHALKVLDGVAGISFTHFSSRDVVRHPLVQRIVDAYERYEMQEGDPVSESPRVSLGDSSQGSEKLK